MRTEPRYAEVLAHLEEETDMPPVVKADRGNGAAERELERVKPDSLEPWSGGGG